MVNVGDTTHDEERGLGEGVGSDLASLEGVSWLTEMEEPPKERDLPDVKEMVPFTCI